MGQGQVQQRQGDRACASPACVDVMIRHGGAPPTAETATKDGLWPACEVKYKIDRDVDSGLERMILVAIDDFHRKTPIMWVPAIDSDRYYVTFEQRNATCPQAHVGCQLNTMQKIWLPYPNYPKSSSPLKHICVLHEMGHCVGLAHEHSRPDRNSHIQCLASIDDVNLGIKGVPFGNYDYYSIMHYGHGAGGIHCKSEELRTRADAGITFSAGDVACIKKLYNGRLGHHGDWHKACDPTRCTPTSCACGGCGLLHDGVNCGYVGMKAHWTCCMREVFRSECSSTHTGFWHGSCMDRRCNAKECFCKNCGGGCTYEGSKAHWSCCNSEQFTIRCLKSPFPTEA